MRNNTATTPASATTQAREALRAISRCQNEIAATIEMTVAIGKINRTKYGPGFAEALEDELDRLTERRYELERTVEDLKEVVRRFKPATR